MSLKGVIPLQLPSGAAGSRPGLWWAPSESRSLHISMGPLRLQAHVQHPRCSMPTCTLMPPMQSRAPPGKLFARTAMSFIAVGMWLAATF